MHCYCRYPISYRDLADMLEERGVFHTPAVSMGPALCAEDGKAVGLVLATEF